MNPVFYSYLCSCFYPLISFQPINSHLFVLLNCYFHRSFGTF